MITALKKAVVAVLITGCLASLGACGSERPPVHAQGGNAGGKATMTFGW